MCLDFYISDNDKILESIQTFLENPWMITKIFWNNGKADRKYPFHYSCYLWNFLEYTLAGNIQTIF